MTDHESGGAPSADTADRLRAALSAYADEVQTRPDAYHRALAEWRQRDRRRRLIGLALAAALITIADVVGVWALNHSDLDHPTMFE
ncbi:MAG: hypothetical protein ACRCYQ_01080, partial [Nocardioides sp.]